MCKIHISAITDITKDKIYYRDDRGCVVYIELEPCANSYETAHNITNKNDLQVRCVGERFFGKYAYYELYTAKHTRMYMDLKTSRIKRFITRITGYDFHTKEFEQFYSIQKRLNANGWTTLDLS